MSEGTNVQGDFGPRGFFSKDTFNSNKLVQIIFFYFLLDITILIDYRIKKNNMNTVISAGLYGISEHMYLLRDFTFLLIQVLSLSRRSRKIKLISFFAREKI